MSQAAGCAEYWSWKTITKKDTFSHVQFASRFAIQSGLVGRQGLQPITAVIDTDRRTALRFTPDGGNRSPAKQHEFVVLPSGEVPGISELPRHLHGLSHRDGLQSAAFHVACSAPLTFSVKLSQVAKKGARIVLTVDGTVAASREFPAGSSDANVDAVIPARIPIGKHVVGLSNTGKDWVALQEFTLDPFVPVLGAVGKGSDDFAVLWIFNRTASGEPGDALEGTVAIPGLKAGDYRVIWWDTYAGKAIAVEHACAASGQSLRLKSPPIRRDVALCVLKPSTNE